MKMILLAASVLALSGVAQAQDATQPPPADSSTMAPAAAPATPADAAPATPPADPGAAAPAAAPADATAAAGATDDSNLPKCSKTVTDKCTQGAGGTHHGKAMHHKK